MNAIRQQTITWSRGDSYLYHCLASSGINELKTSKFEGLVLNDATCLNAAFQNSRYDCHIVLGSFVLIWCNIKRRYDFTSQFQPMVGYHSTMYILELPESLEICKMVAWSSDPSDVIHCCVVIQGRCVSVDQYWSITQGAIPGHQFGLGP